MVDNSLSGERVARELDAIAERRGYPLMEVSDNGSELTSNAHARMAGRSRRRMALHRAWQADAKRLRGELNRRLSDEFLNEHLFTSHRHARESIRLRHSHGHWKTTTFVAGLRLSGMMATMVLDGPINRVCLQAYVKQVLVRELRPGDVVIIDNCPATKASPSARP